MGLKRWGDDRGPSTPTVLVALLVILASTPGALGQITDPVEDHVPGCPGAWWGVAGDGSSSNRVCVYAEASAPHFGKLVGMVSTDVDPEPCPDGFAGTMLEWRNTTVGACYTAFYVVPDRIGPMIGADLSSCEIPDREGEDPVILIGDGAVGFCVVPVVEPGDELPTVHVSTEPCEPETTDPEVRVAGGGARVCADILLYGIGNPQLNLLIGMVETAFETAPDYVPTP